MRPDRLERVWVIHTRPWRETSLTVELFAADAGRVGVVARGARRPRRGGRVLEPFTALSCELRGRGELRTLAAHEVVRRAPLAGDALYAGFYVNELVMRLLQREDPHPRLFEIYEGTLDVLAHVPRERGIEVALEPVLRRFEFALLDDLGYGLPLDVDLAGVPVDPARSYLVRPDTGVVPADAAVVDGPPGEVDLLVPGDDLLAIARGRLDSASVLRAAKRLARAALAPHLGPRPLASRALFARRAERTADES
jgi:DNA repair protein RecO (recombination protein O)